jgi:beta-glucosidase
MKKNFAAGLFMLVTFPVLQQVAFAQTNPTETRITGIIKKMTLQEKVDMIHGSSSFTSGGVKRLGIPELTMSDGPHGVRFEHGRGWTAIPDVEDSGTYLPTGNTLAATWNPALGYAFGSVLGSEAKYRGKDVILGPGINIIRTPLNGRNFEYLSEDPFLISKMVVGYIKGVQDQGISACVKHYAANNQEIERNSISVEMSERALREIYLPGFKAAVQVGKVNTLMGAYNKFRGQWCTENQYLINEILKKEWGFKGVVISDWGAVHNTMEAINNGTDIEMGTDLSMKAHPIYSKFFMGDTVLTLVKNGEVSVKLLDDKVRRILRVMIKTHMLGGKRTPGAYNTKEHQQTALKIAEEGIVLLKNEKATLPLRVANVKTIAVIGQNADRENSSGGGSSQVKAKYEITPLQGLKNLVGDKIKLDYVQGYKIARGQQADEQMIKAAADAAAKADIAIVVGGWTHGYDYSVWNENVYDAESKDKPSLEMPFGQDELIKAVVKANPKTVVVIMGGGGIDMNQWIDKTPAIIQAWYPGMEGGNALAKIIFGEVNPSGKLPMTFPKKLKDVPAEKLGEYPGKNGVVHYNDDIYVGYRYYDTYGVEPLFPFGHGLSYTNFKYDEMVVSTVNKITTVKLNVTNIGKVVGKEVVQLYVHKESPQMKRPAKELKAFNKIDLSPGQTKQVTLTLTNDAFSYYSEAKKQWVVEPGKYDLLAGSSSGDLRVKGVVTK